MKMKMKMKMTVTVTVISVEPAPFVISASTPQALNDPNSGPFYQASVVERAPSVISTSTPPPEFQALTAAPLVSVAVVHHISLLSSMPNR